MTAERNWAGNFTYSTATVLYPETADEVAALVKRHPALRVSGTRHTFNGLPDSDAALLSLARLTPSVTFDHQRKQATVSANMTYGQLCPLLHQAGYALHNMASLPHISVIGACMTATHGSGTGNQTLAAQVAGLRFVTADGDLVSLTRETDGDVFDGAVVSLGALGVVVELTLDLLPAFEMSQHVFLDLPVAQMETHFDAIMSGAYSVSLFTRWNPKSVAQVWLKRRTDDPQRFAHDGDFYGAVPAARQMHPLPELSGDACTQQLGIPGAWHERLPHFRIDQTPSAGAELQTEYFVPRRRAVEALRAVAGLRERIVPHLFISEIRAVAADSFWMSPCRQQDSVAIHFTWKPDWASVRGVLPQIEAALEPFGARPHWGKLFTMPPERVRALYADPLPQFRALLDRYDPRGKFRNAFIQNYIGGGG